MTTLKNVIAQFIQARKAARYSEHTLQDYQNTFKLFSAFVGEDCVFEEITHHTIVAFMASEHVQRVSKKTALNYHTGLSSLWRWALENNFATENVVRKVKPPVPERREITPLTRSEIVRLLNACQQSTQPLRDRAILLLLLDTGIRASEIGNLRIRDINLAERKLLVMGKGKKERILRISVKTRDSLAAYISSREEQKKIRYQEYLFVTKRGRQFRRDALRQLMERLGERAGVFNVHAHRFRHTFAINFLRNGGSIYTLQKLLGHTTLDMVKRYLKISQTDLETDHDKASPVANWDL